MKLKKSKVMKSKTKISLANELTSEIDYYLKKLFPLCRSLTGEKNRITLKILQEIIPLDIFEIESGKKVFDWEIPKEWNIKEAFIADKNGKKIIDFRNSNLHVINYSQPIDANFSWSELKSKLYTHDKIDDAIPYRTSYYKEDWGFCLSKKQYKDLSNSDGPFRVLINSNLSNGSLSLGEYILKGTSDKEILISSYFCHPSMANDSLSGVLLSCFLAKYISKKKNRRWNYRFIFVPETIGAISYCYLNEKRLKNIDVGLVITTVGGKGKFSYKQSWQNNHWINFLIEQNFKSLNEEYITYPFDINGSDERQYSSQGFRINVGSICKDKYYEYPEYHSSKDNLDFVKARQIRKSYEIYVSLIESLESLTFYKNTKPNCEVMLSKYDLYPKLGGGFNQTNTIYTSTDIILWLLFLCDGEVPIEKISYDLNIDQSILNETIKKLIKANLLKKL